MKTYQNLCTQFYELDKPITDSTALKFYFEYAKGANGPIFEPMCGTGLFLIPMIESGFDIEGSDASEFMLQICKKKCAAKNLKPILYRQFLHEMNIEKKYALIFIPSGSFGLMTDMSEAKKCLKIMYDHLLPTGKLVFEVEPISNMPELGVLTQRSVHYQNKDRITLETKSFYEIETQILQTHCKYELFHDDILADSEIENLIVRLYDDYEMDAWLKELGIQQYSRFTSYDQSHAKMKDAVIIYECVKASSSQFY